MLLVEIQRSHLLYKVGTGVTRRERESIRRELGKSGERFDSLIVSLGRLSRLLFPLSTRFKFNHNGYAHVATVGSWPIPRRRVLTIRELVDESSSTSRECMPREFNSH
jgi:hypothetical protein